MRIRAAIVWSAGVPWGVGTMFGSADCRDDIPRLVRLHDRGRLELASATTSACPPEGADQGRADVLGGRDRRRLLLDEKEAR